MFGISYSTRGLLTSSTLIALGLVAQSASAAFIVYRNDSFISVSASVLTAGSPGNSASQTFSTATSIPGSTSGSVETGASAADSWIGVSAAIDYSLTDTAGVVNVSGTSEGSANGSQANGLRPPVEYSSSIVFDLTFLLTSSFEYWLQYDVNGSGGSSNAIELINVSTATQVDYVSAGQNNFLQIDGFVDPGLYRLRVTTGAGGRNPFYHSISNGLNGRFTPTGPEVTPIPAAVWLFGSALGVMGWLRRKTTG